MVTMTYFYFHFSIFSTNVSEELGNTVGSLNWCTAPVTQINADDTQIGADIFLR